MKTKPSAIQIIGNYYLSADQKQFILKEIGNRQKIDKITRKSTDEEIEYEKDLGYYNTIPLALNACIEVATREGIADGTIETLKQCCEFVTESYDTLKTKMNLF